MKRLLILVILLAYVQNLKGQEVSSSYQKWLLETPLGKILEVTDFDEKNKTLLISVHPRYTSAESIRKVYETWDSLSMVYKTNGVNLASIFFNKLKQVTLSSSENLSIEIKSKIPVLFSVSISMEEGVISEFVQYVDNKGANNESINTDGFMFFSDFLPLKVSINSARKIVSKRTIRFFKERFGVANSEIKQESNGNSQEKYVVEKKGIITENYNDRLELSIWYIPITERETEINFEFKAYYARGIMATGQYSKVDLKYLPVLIDIQKSFKNHLNSHE